MANNPLFQLPALPGVGYQNQIDPSGIGAYGQAVQASPSILANVDTSSVANVAQSAAAGPASAGGLWDWFTSKDGMFGSTDPTSGKVAGGWAMPALTLAGGLSSFIQGNAAQDIARGQLKESQRQFDLNYNNQRQTLNTAMEDRQRARVASAGGSGAYESVDSYLARNKV